MKCNQCKITIHEHSIDAVHAGLWAAHWNGKVWCGNCLKIAHVEAKQARQAELDAMSRCEFCTHRGTWNVGAGEPVLLCGWHKRKATRYATVPVLLHTYTGNEVREILRSINNKG